ncbi:capZ-interacting protein-like isoform X2 [Heterodontus francisci]
MEDKPMSVAALASKFRQEPSNTLEKNEKQLKGPIRKKPPCFLPLCGMKNNTEADHNADEKPSVNDSSRHPKLKLKTSSPLIEKLQANLLLSPTALLPGIGPKSPLKSSVSPFASPASTPDSPGARSRSSESDGGPVTSDQPTEAEPLHSFHKSRARVSLKRRPPSRRFRRSVTEDVDNPGSPETEKPGNSDKEIEPQQNGAEDEKSDDVFTDHGVQTDNADSKNSSSPKEDSLASPKEDSLASPKEDSLASPKEDSFASPIASSPEEPSHKELNDLPSSQSQESKNCSNLNQCELKEDNNITAKQTEEYSNKDGEASASIDHNTVGSETAVSETADQEPKIEEAKAIDIDLLINNVEERAPGGTED